MRSMVEGADAFPPPPGLRPYSPRKRGENRSLHEPYFSTKSCGSGLRVAFQ